jgi:hypothetical protein
MYTVLLPPGGNTIAVNKYILSYSWLLHQKKSTWIRRQEGVGVWEWGWVGGGDTMTQLVIYPSNLYAFHYDMSFSFATAHV